MPDYEKDVDWEKIAANVPVLKDTRMSTAPLTQIDYYFEKVFCAASKRSMAADIQSLITEQLRSYKQVRCEAIAFLAKQHGLSFEEAFIRLATDQSLEDN
jgi:hypothetical protein